MSDMMRALQIMAPGDARVVEVPRPTPGPGEVLVQVVCVATCPQWDLHLMNGEPMFPGASLEYPYTVGQPGHEMTGVVVEVGPDVTAPAVGTHVAAWRDQGHHRAGAYAEYVVMDAGNVLTVPDDVDPLRVASLELVMCVSASVLHLRQALDLAGLRGAVNGLGPAGLIAAALLRAEGVASVAGFEVSAARRAFAECTWVDETADPTAPDVYDRFGARWSGRGAIDVAVDCVGYPQAVRFIMDVTSRAVALFAVQRHDYVYATSHAGLTVVGYPGHYRDAAEYGLARILSGAVDLRGLYSTTLPFERYLEGVELLRRQEALKICFTP